ncbi:MAG: hypothetical protein ACM3SU_14695 [Acidobacteriota bacterium]
MKTGKLLPLIAIALLASASRALAESKASTSPRERIVLRQAGAQTAARVPAAAGTGTLGKNAAAAAYSVELSQVVRLQGLAFYRTAVDLTNNTTRGGVTARIQFTYANAACAATGGICRTSPFVITLAGLDNFHQDDMVQFLDSQGLLASGAVDSAVGTLLITFDNLPSNNGWEATATARIYNRVNESDPSQGTYGYAFPASLFFESAHQTLAGTVRDTSPAALSGASIQGSQRTNIGIRNTDIDAPPGSTTRPPVNLQLTFYDVTEGSPTNGQRVGNAIPVIGMVAGEVRIAGNVFSLAQIPSNVSSAICFIDVTSPTPVPGVLTSPTIEGFVVVIDNQTQDGSYFEMKCADPDFACGF